MAEWALGMGQRSWQVSDSCPLFAEQQDYYDALPLSTLPDRAGMSCAWWDDMMQHPSTTTSGGRAPTTITPRWTSPR